MKADRLTRRTYLKPGQVRPDGEITIYDLTAGGFEADLLISLSDFKITGAKEAEEIGALPYAFEKAEDVLGWCAALAGQSPAARAMWLQAAASGWSVGIADLHGGGFHLDVEKRELLLDHFSLTPSALGRSAYFRHTFLLALFRALRDIWHEDRTAPFEDEYAPADILMLERVRAADCDTATVLAAWELRGAGHAEIWRHLIGSAEGDMALIFSRFLERDPGALFDGSALTYAFRQWYADESRVDGCDHQTLEALDDVMLGSAEARPFGARKIEPGAVESLSALPDGICYLAGLGGTILRDPYFAGLHDEINQTHLFQLLYDIEVTMVNNVPFRDRTLARLMFPPSEQPARPQG